MSSIGPQLPPHLTKRKRTPDDESPPRAKTSRTNPDEITLDDDDSDDGYGPTAVPAAQPKPAPARAPTGPTLPPSRPTNEDETPLGDNDSDDSTGPAPQPQPQPRRVMGPAPPPADLSTRPTNPPDDSSSSSSEEDDYGPALPTARSHANPSAPPTATASLPSQPAAPKRDDWMLAPPTSSGYSERDPTKIKARKFASGPGSTAKPGAAGGVSSIWTETPEEKRKRLADAVLGRGGNPTAAAAGPVASAAPGRENGSGSNAQQSAEQEEKIRLYTEQMRGRSLYEEHQAAKKAGEAAAAGGKKGATGQGEDEEEDDPSKRAFDREKDMGLGGKINQSQRRELLNRASNFGGRFEKGKYL